MSKWGRGDSPFIGNADIPMSSKEADKCDDSEATLCAEKNVRASAEDKLRLIADTVDGQAPFGTELANFRRRLQLILEIS